MASRRRLVSSGPASAPERVSERLLKQTFVGYHKDAVATLVLYLSETVAATGNDIEQETDEQEALLSRVREDDDELEQLARCYLLRCATPDSVVRVCSSSSSSRTSSTTALDTEAIWSEYFERQQHMCLSELLESHCGHEDNNKHETNNTTTKQQQDHLHWSFANRSSRLIQVTTYSTSSLPSSTASNTAAVNWMGSTNTNAKRYEVDVCHLRSFETREQLVTRAKRFLAQNTQQQQQQHRFLIVESELQTGDEVDSSAVELIACARHSLCQLLTTTAANNSNSNAHIVLLVRLRKERHTFVGFQLATCSCYHVDELLAEAGAERSVPRLCDRLRSTPLSELLREVATTTTDNHFGLTMSSLLKRLAPHACSLIVDAPSASGRPLTLTRTIERIRLFAHLCSVGGKGNEFVAAVGEHLVALQRDKERSHMSAEAVRHWLARDALGLRATSQYATVRSALAHCLRAKLAPLLAHVLARLDRFSNLDTLLLSTSSSSSSSWKSDMWLSVCNAPQLLRLEYASGMRSADGGSELATFVCQSEWFVAPVDNNINNNNGTRGGRRAQHERIAPSLPFSWLIYEQLEQLRTTATVGAHTSTAAAATAAPRMFAETSWCHFLRDVQRTGGGGGEHVQLLDAYVNDFVLISCPLMRTRAELATIGRLMRAQILTDHVDDEKDKDDVLLRMPALHEAFDKQRSRVDMFLRLCRFDDDNENTTTTTNTASAAAAAAAADHTPMGMSESSLLSASTLHLQACLACVERFKSSFQAHESNLSSHQHNNTRLFALIQLVAEVCAMPVEEEEEGDELMAKCVEQHEALVALRIFVDTVVTPLNAKLAPELSSVQVHVLFCFL